MKESKSLLPSGVSRRRFLQLSSMSLAGAALAACVTPAPVSDTMADEPAMEMIEMRFQNWFNESDMHTWQLGLDTFKERAS